MYDLFLRRSDEHIAAIATSFERTESRQLATALEFNAGLNISMQTLLSHAVRSAESVATRDALQIASALSNMSPQSLRWPRPGEWGLAIKICRICRSPGYTKLVFNEMKRVTGREFRAEVRANAAALGEVTAGIYDRLALL